MGWSSKVILTPDLSRRMAGTNHESPWMRVLPAREEPPIVPRSRIASTKHVAFARGIAFVAHVELMIFGDSAEFIQVANRRVRPRTRNRGRRTCTTGPFTWHSGPRCPLSRVAGIATGRVGRRPAVLHANWWATASPSPIAATTLSPAHPCRVHHQARECLFRAGTSPGQSPNPWRRATSCRRRGRLFRPPTFPTPSLSLLRAMGFQSLRTWCSRSKGKRREGALLCGPRTNSARSFVSTSSQARSDALSR